MISMATNIPPHNTAPPEISSSGWAVDPTSSSGSPPNNNNNNIRHNNNTIGGGGSSSITGLEDSLSGMNLNNHNNNQGRGSATPPPMGLASSGDSVQSHHSTASHGGGGGFFGGGGNSSVAGSVGSAPATLSRPPGLAINLQPPISHVTGGNNHHHHHHHQGHTKNSASTSSSTAQTAILTPTSSLDGGASADLYGMNTSRQSVVHSPVNSSVSAADHLPGLAGLGSFDTEDDRSHDGLLGLQALRDRAHSSPGPVLSSSPISAANNSYSTSPRTIGVPPARPRTVSKDSGRGVSSGSSRPPLAGGSALSPPSMAIGGDFGGSIGVNRSRDASPPPPAGVISRPPEQQAFSPYADSGGNTGGDRGFDSSLRRALSDAGSDYNRNSTGGDAGGFINDSKFNTASPFAPPHHTRGLSGGPGLPPSLQGGPGVFQRHNRSQSQPGPRMPTPEYYGNIPAHGDHGGVPGFPRRGSDYSSGYQHGGGGADEYGGGNEGGYGGHGGVSGSTYPRSMSMQHSNNIYSDPNFHDNHHRRGSTGYYGGRRDRDLNSSYEDHGGRKFGNNNYPRQDRLISPAHSPHHSSYGGHSRQSSDMGSSALTSSPMSLSSGPLYNRRRDVGPTDEDLSHPLAGESIEVPGEEQYFNDTHAHVLHSRAHSIGHAPSYHSDSRSLPTAGAGLPPFRAVYNVKFKRTQRPFEIGPRLTRDLKVGTYVKVEADRGEDLGIVVGYVGKGLGVPQQRASFGGGMGDPPAAANSQMPHDRKKIIRLATHDEVALLQMKRDEEDELLRVCRMKVRQRGLLMNVVDAEYQFDRHKLTFFFEAEGRVDFRELVRDLFSIYKTRIWMQQLDKSISATCPAAPEPESLAMDYGTPILAPAHEYEDFATANVGAGDEDGFNGLHDHM